MRKSYEEVAKFFLKNYQLVIAGKPHSIESVSIHHGNEKLIKKKVSCQGHWFIVFSNRNKGEYLSYIDYDITKSGDASHRLRINAIRDSKGNPIGSSGEVFDYVKMMIGEPELAYSNNRKVSKKNTPKFYLEKIKTKNENIYQLPRYLGNMRYGDAIRRVRELVDPLMFTKSFDWMKHDYYQKILIGFYFIKKIDASIYPSDFLPSPKILKKYAVSYNEGKAMSLSQIKLEYQSTVRKKHKIFYARIAGYYFK